MVFISHKACCVHLIKPILTAMPNLKKVKSKMFQKIKNLRKKPFVSSQNTSCSTIKFPQNTTLTIMKGDRGRFLQE